MLNESTSPIMSGAEKAAVVMLALNNGQSVNLLARMKETEIQEISVAMAKIGMVKSTAVEHVLGEFVDRSPLAGQDEPTPAAVPPPAPGAALAQLLTGIEDDRLAAYLESEYPQTIAVVLSQLPRSRSARLIQLLPTEVSADVMSRMLTMGEVKPAVIASVEKALKAELERGLPKRRRGTMAPVASAAHPETQTLRPKSATAAVTFNDLLKLDDPSVRTLIGAVDRAMLALALKGASDGLRDRFASGMTPRAGQVLRGAIDSLGPVRLRDVDLAQAAIVATASRLAASGAIAFARVARN